MRLALINPIIQTVDRPRHFWSLFGRRAVRPLASDEEVNSVKLARTFVSLGHEVDLFIADAFRPLCPSPPVAGLSIHYLPTRVPFLFPPAYIPFLPSLVRELRRKNFDAVQCWDLFQPSTFLASFCKHPLFVWEEMDYFYTRPAVRWLQKFHQAVFERRLKRRGAIIPRSQSAKAFLEKRGWKTLEAVPTPVDASLFKPLPGVSEDCLLVVTRLAPDRGLDFLLSVIEALIPRKPGLKFLVVGQGAEEQFLRGEIRRRGWEKILELRSIFFSHAELNRVYNQSFMTLITTEGGIFPYTVLESMSAGKPVISRFKRGLKDLIQNDATGYLVDGVEEMAQKILHLLEQPEKRRLLGKEARKRILEYCDFRAVAGKFLKTYQLYA